MNFVFTAIGILVSIFLLMPAASASDAEQIASLMWSYPKDAAVEGDYAFCTVEYGLIVFDISSAGDPVEVSRLFMADPSRRAEEIVLYGDYAYIRLGNFDLAIVDISDPANPQLRSNYQTSKSILQIMINGSMIYYTAGEASYENEFNILDVSDPENPVIRGSFTES